MEKGGNLNNLKRLIPFAIILAITLTIYLTGVQKYLSFETLKEHHEGIEAYTKKHFWMVSLLFILSYILIAALSIPTAFFLSLLGGYLFPQPLSLIYVVVGATIGASLLFLAAKNSFKRILKKQVRPFLRKMERGFKKNAGNYLLFLRFVPLVPFWVVNLAPAFFNVRLKTFVWTTFVGVIPGSLATTLAGQGLSEIFDSNKPFSIEMVFNTELKVALVLLALVSLLPIMIKKRDDRRKK